MSIGKDATPTSNTASIAGQRNMIARCLLSLTFELSLFTCPECAVGDRDISWRPRPIRRTPRRDEIVVAAPGVA
jgi:hypothetical protein